MSRKNNEIWPWGIVRDSRTHDVAALAVCLLVGVCFDYLIYHAVVDPFRGDWRCTAGLGVCFLLWAWNWWGRMEPPA